MGTHPAIGLVLPSFFVVTILWVWMPVVREHVLSSLQGLQTVFCLFAIFAPLCTQYIKRVHLIPALRGTDAAGAIDAIALPGKDGMIKEVFVYGLVAMTFWAGLHVHLLSVIVCFFLRKKVFFGAAHAATDEITGEHWIGAAKRVLSRYKRTYLFLGSILVLLCLLLELDVLPAREEWLLPLLLILIGPMLALLLLDPSVVFATQRTVVAQTHEVSDAALRTSPR